MLNKTRAEIKPLDRGYHSSLVPAKAPLSAPKLLVPLPPHPSSNGSKAQLHLPTINERESGQNPEQINHTQPGTENKAKRGLLRVKGAALGPCPVVFEREIHKRGGLGTFLDGLCPGLIIIRTLLG